MLPVILELVGPEFRDALVSVMSFWRRDTVSSGGLSPPTTSRPEMIITGQAGGPFRRGSVTVRPGYDGNLPAASAFVRHAADEAPTAVSCGEGVHRPVRTGLAQHRPRRPGWRRPAPPSNRSPTGSRSPHESVRQLGHSLRGDSENGGDVPDWEAIGVESGGGPQGGLCRPGRRLFGLVGRGPVLVGLLGY